MQELCKNYARIALCSTKCVHAKRLVVMVHEPKLYGKWLYIALCLLLTSLDVKCIAFKLLGVVSKVAVFVTENINVFV